MIEVPPNVMAHIEDLDEVIGAVHAANIETGVRHGILLVARAHDLFTQVRELARRELPSYAWGERDDAIALSLSQSAVDRIAANHGVPFDPPGVNEIAVLVMDGGAYAVTLCRADGAPN